MSNPLWADTTDGRILRDIRGVSEPATNYDDAPPPDVLVRWCWYCGREYMIPWRPDVPATTLCETCGSIV